MIDKRIYVLGEGVLSRGSKSVVIKPKFGIQLCDQDILPAIGFTSSVQTRLTALIKARLRLIDAWRSVGA